MTSITTTADDLNGWDVPAWNDLARSHQLSAWNHFVSRSLANDKPPADYASVLEPTYRQLARLGFAGRWLLANFRLGWLVPRTSHC